MKYRIKTDQNEPERATLPLSGYLGYLGLLWQKVKQLHPYKHFCRVNVQEGVEIGTDRLSCLARTTFIKRRHLNESSPFSTRQIYSKLFLTYNKQHASKNHIKPPPPPHGSGSRIWADSKETLCLLFYSCSILLSAFLLIFILRAFACSLPLLLASRWAFRRRLTARAYSSSCRACRFSWRRRMLSLRAVSTSQSLEPADNWPRHAYNPSKSSSGVRVWVSYLILPTSMLILYMRTPKQHIRRSVVFMGQKIRKGSEDRVEAKMLVSLLKCLPFGKAFDRKQSLNPRIPFIFCMLMIV